VDFNVVGFFPIFDRCFLYVVVFKNARDLSCGDAMDDKAVFRFVNCEFFECGIPIDSLSEALSVFRAVAVQSNSIRDLCNSFQLWFGGSRFVRRVWRLVNCILTLLCNFLRVHRGQGILGLLIRRGKNDLAGFALFPEVVLDFSLFSACFDFERGCFGVSIGCRGNSGPRFR